MCYVFIYLELSFIPMNLYLGICIMSSAFENGMISVLLFVLMCMCMYIYMWVQVEGIFPRAGVTEVYELLDIGLEL